MVLGEIRDYLFASVSRQPPIYRETVRLRFMEGKDLKEIAETTNVPLGTVKARLNRAPDLLRNDLHIQQTTIRFLLEKRPSQPD
jgi:DNA-directed RNA polymerase specialized sigma24 family protein